jgi:hypothetical protein
MYKSKIIIKKKMNPLISGGDSHKSHKIEEKSEIFFLNQVLMKFIF